MTQHADNLGDGPFSLPAGLLDNLDQGVSIFDGELRLVAWNRRFVELLRLPPGLARAGCPYADLVRYLAERGEFGPGDAAEIVAARVRAAERCVRFYTERTTSSGRLLAAQTNPLPAGGFVTVYTDVTERTLAETLTPKRSDELEARVNQRTLELRTVNAQLRQNIRRLEEASAAREKSEQALHQAQKMSAIGQLAGGLAHDFNNLLTVIVGNLGSLRDRIDGSLAKEYLEPAVRASYRGVDITRRLLAFARQQSLEPAPVDVPGLIAGTAQLLRRSLPTSIAIQCEAEGEGWNALADSAQLENAIINLALNARDAMPDGGTLTFRTSYRALAENDEARGTLAPGDYVQIAVVDTGTGIEPDVLSRVFEPFFTTKRFGAGSGLGLSMAFGFVRQSGGDIRIESEPGKGTCVSLLLPRAEGGAPVEVASDYLPVVAGDGQLVLLVEDHEDVRQSVRRQLLELGYQVLEARDGEDAQSLLSVPDLSALVSDVIMPGALNGLALADQARRLVPGIKIVLISGFAQLLSSGYDWFDEKLVLRKPFGKAELARALSRTSP